MSNLIAAGVVLTSIVIYSTNAQLLNRDKKFEFSNWKNKQGKEYGDKAQEALR